MKAALTLLLLAASAVSPPRTLPEGDALEPATGRFLVATPRIRGSVFAQSVVFLYRYGRTESAGLIVNLPTATALEALFPGIGAAAGALHLGGPVDPATMLVLVRTPAPPQRAMQITGDVFLTSDEATLREVAAGPDAARHLRVYAGYAGWGRGQLDAEIARGDWIVVRTPPDPIFDAEPRTLWRKLLEKHRRLIARAPEAAPAVARLARGGGAR